MTPEERREKRREYMREYSRRYAAANREKRREYERRYRAANAEKLRDAARRWREANPEKAREVSRESQRRHRKANPEKVRETKRREYLKNRDKILERRRNWAAVNPGYGLRNRHGVFSDEAFAAMWAAQSGLCYLCERPLDPERMAMDHDHSCCPPQKSCAYCRRGLAHPNCNSLIGFAEDNPELLRLIAANLEPVLEATRERIATKPAQDELPFTG